MDELKNKLRAAMNPRTLCVEVSGGVVQDVHGLPEGWSYELADWDELDGIDAFDHEEKIKNQIEAKINRAKKLS